MGRGLPLVRIKCDELLAKDLAKGVLRQRATRQRLHCSAEIGWQAAAAGSARLMPSSQAACVVQDGMQALLLQISNDDLLEVSGLLTF
ncbi:hypothetical protein BLL52_3201 [Rhodoferax antarcticus ANT.BR]|uniref:Uncharacterized protein n=1 Tax=Rhodoferax antarcticus ANT.BR TaxID=1111071 RepID=A0A1Q8YBW1_9BURK|nr:hypothetical protein BLL52_3201 [Rhodoferax antarcticus ANT.BR]